MRILEQQCPHCNAKLRLRGPARGGQELSCPDCSNPLVVAVTSDGVSLVASSPAIPTMRVPAAASNHTSPTVIAWGVAAALLLLLLGWSFWESDEFSTHPAVVEAPVQSESVSSGPEQLEPATPENKPGPTLPPAPVKIDQPASEIASVDATPPADEPSETNETSRGTPDELPATSTPVAPPPMKPTLKEDEKLAAAQAAEDAATVATIRERLSIPVGSYHMQQAQSLGVFLDELSRLTATWINTNGFEENLSRPVQVSLTDTTPEAVLAAGLKQAELRFEISRTGLHLVRD